MIMRMIILLMLSLSPAIVAMEHGDEARRQAFLQELKEKRRDWRDESDDYFIKNGIEARRFLKYAKVTVENRVNYPVIFRFTRLNIVVSTQGWNILPETTYAAQVQPNQTVDLIEAFHVPKGYPGEFEDVDVNLRIGDLGNEIKIAVPKWIPWIGWNETLGHKDSFDLRSILKPLEEWLESEINAKIYRGEKFTPRQLAHYYSESTIILKLIRTPDRYVLVADFIPASREGRGALFDQPILFDRPQESYLESLPPELRTKLLEYLEQRKYLEGHKQ